MKRIALLGSTGSIGQNVLDVVERHPDQFQLVGLAARRDSAGLSEQARRHPDALVTVTDPDAAAGLDGGLGARVVGSGSLVDLIERSQPDLVVNAVVGFAGLRPTMAALEAGIPVAIANKETIVTGGEILQRAARDGDGALIPIDSEHVAIAQCLRGEALEDVDRVILTASGGALRDRDADTLDSVTIEDVLAHPTWDMGAKITVDSATLVNKGLEVIEGHWLFGVPYEKIDVVIHPPSIVHSMVRFVDGSIIAQMGEPDMRLPILYALSWPGRVASPLKHDVLGFPELSFAPVVAQRYPCFELVMAAAREGGSAPTVLNAANELAVAAFLEGRVPFTRIREIIDAALDGIETSPIGTLDDIMAADARARRWIAERFGIDAQTGENTESGS
jgi:1-deoxy-D-xylulose-5-phosphate reductoisomerase